MDELVANDFYISDDIRSEILFLADE